MISFKQSFLNEISIDAHYSQFISKKYEGLSLETYKQLSTVDPTTSNNNKGKYVEWILKIINNKAKLFQMNIEQFLSTHMHSMPISKITKSLEKYNNYPTKQDINSFKTFAQFFEYVDLLPMTGKQLKTQEKEIYSDTKNIKILDDNDWIVARPLTYEGSKKLAYYKTSIGADWCTARRDNDYAFNDYDQRGILFVLINKAKPQEKFQAFLDLETLYVDEVQDAAQNNVGWDNLVKYIGKNKLTNTLKYISQFRKYK